jgi:hypothetical protein
MINSHPGGREAARIGAGATRGAAGLTRETDALTPGAARTLRFMRSLTLEGTNSPPGSSELTRGSRRLRRRAVAALSGRAPRPAGQVSCPAGQGACSWPMVGAFGTELR